MAKTLLVLPIPSSHFTRGAKLATLPQRRCELMWSVEGEGTAEVQQSLVFDGVESFRCTYHKAVAATNIRTAYDKLIELEGSAYLMEIRGELEANDPAIVQSLRHLAIYFDGGPYFEFIAKDYAKSF